MVTNKTKFEPSNFILEDGTVITPETMANWYDKVCDYLERLTKEHERKNNE